MNVSDVSRPAYEQALARWQLRLALRAGQLKEPGTYLLKLEVDENGRRKLQVYQEPKRENLGE